MEHMRRNAPQVPVILDAKRGDIGSTAEQYAHRGLRALRRRCRHALALHGLRLGRALSAATTARAPSCCAAPATPAATTCRRQRLAGLAGEPLLYEHVARLAQGPWNLNGQLGPGGRRHLPGRDRARARAGAHRAAPDPRRRRAGRRCGRHRASAGWRADAPIIVNSSRAIIYASAGDDFAQAARRAATQTRDALEAAKS